MRVVLRQGSCFSHQLPACACMRQIKYVLVETAILSASEFVSKTTFLSDHTHCNDRYDHPRQPLLRVRRKVDQRMAVPLRFNHPALHAYDYTNAKAVGPIKTSAARSPLVCISKAPSSITQLSVVWKAFVRYSSGYEELTLYRPEVPSGRDSESLRLYCGRRAVRCLCLYSCSRWTRC